MRGTLRSKVNLPSDLSALFLDFMQINDFKGPTELIMVACDLQIHRKSPDLGSEDLVQAFHPSP